jgi:hypothetical protein
VFRLDLPSVPRIEKLRKSLMPEAFDHASAL